MNPTSPASDLAATRQTVSVVVPVFNLVAKSIAVFERTLASIRGSIEYTEILRPGAFAFEVVIVDDCSSDSTWDWLKTNLRGEGIKLVRHSTNLGYSGSRNTGVRETTGELLFFCDDDDVVFKEHFSTGLEGILRPLPPELKPRIDIHGHLPAFAKSGIYIRDYVHPAWLRSIELSVVFNMCVRRVAHETIGGFPEADVFRSGGEDQLYSRLLRTYFCGAWASLRTVEYIRYQGNSLDRQLHRFSRPPSKHAHEIVTGRGPDYWREYRAEYDARCRAVEAFIARRAARSEPSR